MVEERKRDDRLGWIEKIFMDIGFSIGYCKFEEFVVVCNRKDSCNSVKQRRVD